MFADTKLAPFNVFVRRQLLHAAAAFVLVAFALGVGIAGYHWIAAEDWTDSLLNASMILSGEGPVDRLPTRAAKIFASAYALFGGLDSKYKPVLAFVVLILLLLYRPQGLFGQARVL